MKTAAIVLAAGGSSRLGRPKQLVVHEGEALLASTVRKIDEAGFSPILVVLGASADACRKVLEDAPVEIVHHLSWREGMGSSLAAGSQALVADHPEAEATLVALCDQPRLTTDHYRKLREATPPVATIYDDHRSCPAVFPRESFSQLTALQGDAGARHLLRGAESIHEIPAPEGALDLDTEDDLKRLEGA
ncbi:nucleotidyltransferase family protein [Haloferula sargassicola]|uniref:Nicotine blue oxidoreductase n=1 Tax=Haloferula sargassicola TaxID=490096 RepID=A0ABP9UTL7_9BACT